MHKGAEMLHEAQLFLTKVQQSAFYSAAPHATHPYCGQIFLRKIFGGKYIYIEFCKRNCHKVLGSVRLCHKVVLFEAFSKKLFCDFSFEAFCKKLSFATFLLRLFIKSRPKIFKRYSVSQYYFAMP